MPENVNCDAVWQSFTDTWFPMIIVAVTFIAGMIFFKIVRKNKRK